MYATQSINEIFAPLGLHVDDIIQGAQSIKYILNMPLDYKFQGKVRRAEKDIRYTLESVMGKEFTYGRENNYVYVETKSDVFRTVPFKDFEKQMQQNKLLLALGTDTNGKKVYTSLEKAVHILVGGTTGSGKSELLHTFIASIITGKPYTNATLLIIDPKSSEYTPYKNTKSVTLVTDMDIAVRCLNKTVEIMQERYAMLEKAGVKDIAAYNNPLKMNHIIIVIDELADLILEHPEVEKPIVRIAQKARACGIHLIIGTQSPRRSVVTGLIAANMPTKIALKTSDQIESRIILNRKGAESLYGKGDMLYLGNGAFDTIRIQAAYISEQEKIEIGYKYREESSQTNQEQPTRTNANTTQYQSNNYYAPNYKKKPGFFQKIKNVLNSEPHMTTSEFVANHYYNNM